LGNQDNSENFSNKFGIDRLLRFKRLVFSGKNGVFIPVVSELALE